MQIPCRLSRWAGGWAVHSLTPPVILRTWSGPQTGAAKSAIPLASRKVERNPQTLSILCSKKILSMFANLTPVLPTQSTVSQWSSAANKSTSWGSKIHAMERQETVCRPTHHCWRWSAAWDTASQVTRLHKVNSFIPPIFAFGKLWGTGPSIWRDHVRTLKYSHYSVIQWTK
jgi:hypothetical protein